MRPRGPARGDIIAAMAKLLFNLRNVPEDEADEVRQLLTTHGVDWYETRPGPWGISTGALAKSPISPHGRRRDAGLASRDATLPVVRIAAMAGGGLALLFLVLWFLVEHAENGTLQKLNLLPG